MNTQSNALALGDTERRIADRIDPTTMDGLSVSSTAGGVVFANAAEVMNFAKMMAVANSGVRKHLRGNVGACLAIITQAVEWGMSPFAVANKSYFVNDQIAFESQLVQAVILKRAPIRGRIKFEFTGTGDKRKCRAWARLKDDPDEIVEYESPEIGQIHPKNSPLWKSDPDQQHCYYAGRALCRRHFPDILLGVYGEDEMTPMPAVGGPRDVTPAKGLTSRLDDLAARVRGPAPTAEPAGDFVVDQDPGGDTDTAAPEPEPAQQQPDGASAAPDPQNPDYLLGYEGGMRGLRKGLTTEIKNDPVRMAAYQAGYAEGEAQRARDPD